MGDTITHYAAYKGQKLVLKYLIDNKAKFDLKNSVFPIKL